MNRRTVLAALGAACLTLVLAACGNGTSGSASSAADPPQPPSSSTTATDPQALTAPDLWVQAGKGEMTAAFGTLTNNTDADLNVVSASSDLARRVETHETVMDDSGAMVMRPKEGGFVIPAGGTFELAPGGNHLMMMDLARTARPGEPVAIELGLADGTTVSLEATVKRFEGGGEKYVPNMQGDDSMSQDMQGSE